MSFHLSKLLYSTVTKCDFPAGRMCKIRSAENHRHARTPMTSGCSQHLTTCWHKNTNKPLSARGQGESSRNGNKCKFEVMEAWNQDEKEGWFYFFLSWLTAWHKCCEYSTYIDFPAIQVLSFPTRPSAFSTLTYLFPLVRIKNRKGKKRKIENGEKNIFDSKGEELVWQHQGLN